MEFRSPRARQLWDKWRYVWMLAWERQRRLHEHLMYLHDLERVRQFSWDDWRKRVCFSGRCVLWFIQCILIISISFFLSRNRSS